MPRGLSNKTATSNGSSSSKSKTKSRRLKDKKTAIRKLDYGTPLTTRSKARDLKARDLKAVARKLEYSDAEGETSNTANFRIDVESSPFVVIEKMPDKLTLKIPAFCTKDIEAWFRRVGSVFKFCKTEDEKERYYAISSHIDHPAVTNLQEIINEPAENPYTALKTKIIEIFKASTSSRINKLLSDLQLGDLKPSQLLAEIRRIGGDIGDDILRNLWSKRLPMHVQTVVAAATESTLDQVAKIADTVIEVVDSSRVQNVGQANDNQMPSTSSSANDELQDLRAALQQLTLTVNEMYANNRRSRSTSRNIQQNRDRSGSFKLREDRICRYHRRFSEAAFLCTKPCSFDTKKPDNSKN